MVLGEQSRKGQDTEEQSGVSSTQVGQQSGNSRDGEVNRYPGAHALTSHLVSAQDGTGDLHTGQQFSTTSRSPGGQLVIRGWHSSRLHPRLQGDEKILASIGLQDGQQLELSTVRA